METNNLVNQEPKGNVNCFAYLNEDKQDGCYCLSELVCAKKKCSFFKPKGDVSIKKIEAIINGENINEQ